MTPHSGPAHERLISIFLTLAAIDSVSGKEAGIAAYVRDFFHELSLDCHEDDAGSKTGGESGNLIVNVPARSWAEPEPFILNAHLDTVTPGTGVVCIEGRDRISSNGQTMLGADDKAGVAAILASVESLVKGRKPHRAINVVFTVREEEGLVGAKNLDISLVDGRWGLVLDGAGEVGGIVVEAPSQDRLKFVVHGKSAHAGVEPEKGINAISCAARAINGLRLGRLDERTTANIGIVKGGSAVNIVPDLVTVEGELRSLLGERLDEERGKVIAGFHDAAAACGCVIEVEVERSFEHFKIDTGSKAVKLLCSAMEAGGITPAFVKSGGGSDANVLNGMGFEMLNMNIGVVNSHSLQEYILKSDLEAVAGIITGLAQLKNGGSNP